MNPIKGRTCEVCGKQFGVLSYRIEINGKAVRIWAHTPCLKKKRKELEKA